MQPYDSATHGSVRGRRDLAMTEQKKGWDIPADFAEQYNRNSFLTMFPPAGGLRGVQGAMLQGSKYRSDELVSLQTTDLDGKLTMLWMDAPNAMYLLSLLLNIQREAKLKIPSEQPPPTKPHSP